MRILTTLITLALAGGSGYMVLRKTQDNDPESSFNKRLAKIADICTEATPYINNPDRYNRTVGETVTFREPKYARLLKDAQEVLGISDAADEFDAFNKLRLQNRKLRNEITGLKKKRLLVPKDSKIPFATTQASIKKDIENLENQITENSGKIETIKARILEIFYSHNLKLQEKELEYFLISAVIANIRKYRDKLDGIFMEAENNYNEALCLKAQSDPSNGAHIESNLSLNRKTLKIVKLYDGLLERRIANLCSSQNSVSQKVNIARNTYKTLDNGSMLINLVSRAGEEYSLVINFEMPELKSIYDAGLLNAFMDISERIREGK